ncbi:MAG: EAL domain-containing protein [Pseudomonadota bacterium]
MDRSATRHLAENASDPIHVAAGLQPGACLLLVDPKARKIVATSANCADFTGRPAADLCGQDPNGCFQAQSGPDLADLAAGSTPAPWMAVLSTGAPVWVSAFQDSGLIGLSLEPAAMDAGRTDSGEGREGGAEEGPGRHVAPNPDGERLDGQRSDGGQLDGRQLDGRQLDGQKLDGQRLDALLAEIRGEFDALAGQDERPAEARITALAQCAVRHVHALTGFDQVALMALDDDGTGLVHAQTGHAAAGGELCLAPGEMPVDPSDLHGEEGVLVTDAAARPVSLVPAGLDTARLALAHCAHRMPGLPQRIRLLRQGWRAALCLPLGRAGRRWGVLICTGAAPNHSVDPACRSTCRRIADLIGMAVQRIEDDLLRRHRQRLHHLVRQMRNRLAAGRRAPFSSAPTFQDVLAEHSPKILGLLEADGLVLQLKSGTFCLGSLPGEKGVSGLCEALAAREEIGLVSSSLGTVMPDLASALLPKAAGAISVWPEGDAPKLILVRRAVNPVAQSPEIFGRSRPWRSTDTILAQELCEDLAEIGSTAPGTPVWDGERIETGSGRGDLSALCDPVTGLPDRDGLCLQVRKSRDGTQPDSRSGAPWSVCLCVHIEDLDSVIARQGDRAGDQLLRQVALRLKSVCRRHDILARTDHTVFSIILAGESDRVSLRLLADRIGTLIETPLAIMGRVMRLSCRVGIATAPGADPETLVEDAEIALREARRTDRPHPLFYTPALRKTAQGQYGQAEELHGAVLGGGFVCLYQPRVDATTLEVRALEALVHWQHPAQGLVAPSDYRDLAEELALREEIDALALSKAMQDREAWLAEGLTPPPVTLSVSARRLNRRDLIDNMRRMQPPPSAVSMAFQEAAFLDGSYERTRWNIEALRELGVGIEIDAFGAGQTSMLSLLHVMPDRLKIHRLLVEPILRSETALSLVESIVEIGHTVGIGVVADGVETMSHISYLRDIGCDHLQGSAFGASSLAAAAIPGLVARPDWLQD